MLLLVNVDALGENWWHPLVYQPHPQWAGDLSIHWPVAGILLALATGNSQQVVKERAAPKWGDHFPGKVN